MKRLCLPALLALAPSMAIAAQAQGVEAPADPYAMLHEADVRVAVISERLQQANQAMCRQSMPMTGMILHSADQYRSPRADWFGDGEVALSQVLPGSPADEAGLAANDAVVAINGMPLEDIPAGEGRPRRDSVFDYLAAQTGTDPLAITVRRNGQLVEASLAAPEGCRAMVEVLADDGRTARADGRVVQVSYGIVARLSDNDLAVILAHELGHMALEHRRRLSEAGVAEGLAREFGRNRRLSRQAELEADAISLHMLANAGYDPAIAPHFWLSDAGAAFSYGVFRSNIYPSRQDRAELMQREIDGHLAGVALPSVPTHLLDRRDAPFED